MKLFLIVAACGAAGWYYFFPGAKMDEEMVRQLYVAESHATLSRDPEALCKLFATKLILVSEVTMMGQIATEQINRKQACEAQRASFKNFEEIGDKMGGILYIDYRYEIGSIAISPNQKRATVQVSRVLKMGGGLMEFKSTSTEELVREWGSMYFSKIDQKVRVRMDAQAMAGSMK
jgi:hypothetical protein